MNLKIGTKQLLGYLFAEVDADKSRHDLQTVQGDCEKGWPRRDAAAPTCFEAHHRNANGSAGRERFHDSTAPRTPQLR
jgi:hypothetical protein